MVTKLTSTTASEEDVEAIKRFMEIFAEVGEGESVDTVYKGGHIHVWKHEGRFHAAIDVVIGR